MPSHEAPSGREGRPPRRVRYAGKNPKRFSDRYKEHAPERFPETIGKVLASGRTPAGSHRPVMVAQVLAALDPRPGETAVDATLGHGGHAERILERILPGGRLLGLDVDPRELPRARERLLALGVPEGCLLTRRTNHAGLSRALAVAGLGLADVVLADLGCSSMQLDDPARGFTFKVDAPLDLRMNPDHGQPASALLARLDADELAARLRSLGDEPHAQEIARALKAARPPVTRTVEAARIVREALQSLGRSRLADPVETSVRRVFQTLRILVNDELTALAAFLAQLPDCLAPGGRVAILTFHSGEDRLVKHAMRDHARIGVYEEWSRDPVRPGADEVRANPRASCAKLRWARRPR